MLNKKRVVNESHVIRIKVPDLDFQKKWVERIKGLQGEELEKLRAELEARGVELNAEINKYTILRDHHFKWISPEELRKSTAKAPKVPHISRPPGSLLLFFAEFIYSPDTYEKVFQQIISDMREEYYAALLADRKWKAKWIRVRYLWALLTSIGLSAYSGFVTKVIGIWKTSSK